MSYTPQVTQQAFEHFYANRVVCDAGGEPRGPGGPGDMRTSARPTPSFARASSTAPSPPSTEPRPGSAARDPCGDTASIIDALVQDLKSLSRVKAPVLLVCGREDAVTPDFACPYLKRRYIGSKDVSLIFVRERGSRAAAGAPGADFRRRVLRVAERAATGSD